MLLYYKALEVIKRKAAEINVRKLLVSVAKEKELVRTPLFGRLLVLKESTYTLKEERRAIKLARRVFDHYEKHHPGNAFTKEEKVTIEIGTLFSDIGKTGPPHASLKQQKIIASIFGVRENINGRMPLHTAIKKFFPANIEEYTSELKKLDIDMGITMRTFWNKHAEWTFHLIYPHLRQKEAIPAAANHHRLEGVNPNAIVKKDDNYKYNFGNNTSFSRAEKLIIILDKYDAYTERSKLGHKEAIKELDKYISKTYYGNDREFMELLRETEKALSF